VVNFQDSNIINNWENNSADALQPFFWTISTIKNYQKSPLFWNLKREPFITESISSPTVRKNKLVAKKKLTSSTYHRPPKFFVPLGKIGPKGTPSTTTTSSWENNHEYQYHPSAITPDLTISFSQNFMDFEEKT